MPSADHPMWFVVRIGVLAFLMLLAFSLNVNCIDATERNVFIATMLGLGFSEFGIYKMKGK